MALRHANSAGSTWMALNLLIISWSTRMSENGDTLLPGEVPAAGGGGGRWSGSEKSGHASMGIDHCMAHSRNSSLHDSSRRITWKRHSSHEKSYKIQTHKRWWWCRAYCPRMSGWHIRDKLWPDQCLSMFQCCFTSTETILLIGTGSPERPPRLSHSSWTLTHIKRFKRTLFIRTKTHSTNFRGNPLY